MKSEGEKERAPDCTSGFAEDAPISPLHDCACYFISLAHSWLERMTHFPFPIGTIIGCAEYWADRWTHPLTEALQCHGLSLLSSIDDQIFSLVEGCGLCSKVKLKVVLSQLYTHGLLGTSAGLWVKYELVVKENIRTTVSLADRVPIINLVTPLFISLISPSATGISDWLLKQGERTPDKSIRTVDSSLKQEATTEGPDIVITKRALLVDPVQPGMTIKVGSADVQYVGKQASSLRDGEGCLVERRGTVKDAAVHAKEDTNQDDALRAKEDTKVEETHSERIDVDADGIVEGDVCSERDGNVGDDKAVHAGKAKGLHREGGDGWPDVLEMLESSWLLGTSAFPKKAPTFSHK